MLNLNQGDLRIGQMKMETELFGMKKMGINLEFMIGMRKSFLEDTDIGICALILQFQWASEIKIDMASVIYNMIQLSP
jgi:hypothetical protein